MISSLALWMQNIKGTFVEKEPQFFSAQMHDAWKQRQEFEAPPLASLDASIARLPPYSRGPNIASNEEMMGCKLCSQCNIWPDLNDIK